MILLTGFAFLAGLVTILSPCILPILPIILSSSLGDGTTSKSRPLGVVTGFVLSFTFFTLFLSTLVRISGIPADTLRFVSVIIIASLGISLLIPKFQALLEQLFTHFSSFLPAGNSKAGFGNGMIVGFSLGLLWTPCVGPILASVISLAISGTVSIDAFIITLAYSIGTAIPMFLIILGGQQIFKKVPWLLRNTSKIQKGFGVVMILTAIAIITNVDRRFQTFILNTFPNYGVGLTQFEDTVEVKKQLDQLGKTTLESEDMGKPTFEMEEEKKVLAPELIPGGTWFNSSPLTLNQLKGKVILIDFWTYSCINCQRTLPYLNRWWQSYNDKGLVIIGVHSPEFEFEKSQTNVATAIADFDLKYPIVQDNAFETWRAYHNRYWPAKYLIDKNGYIRYAHFGEGKYDETESMIQALLAETGAQNLSQTVHNPEYKLDTKTPETYLGYTRITGFASIPNIARDQLAQYSAPEKLALNQIAFDGNWTITAEYASPNAGATLRLAYAAQDVYLVMRPRNTESQVVITTIPSQTIYGQDVIDRTVTVTEDRLFHLIHKDNSQPEELLLEFPQGNIEVYAFTFG